MVKSPRPRLPISTFDMPIHELRRGYRGATYFWREKIILQDLNPYAVALMQVFQKNHAVLCGVDEAIAVLRLCSGFYSLPEQAYKLFDAHKHQRAKIRFMYAYGHYHELESASQELVKLELALNELWENKSGELKIEALYDGDRVSPWETVLTIDGFARHFAHLESIYLGILARQTLVATNVAGVTEAAQGKPILFFADRFDRYENQPSDGYAAMRGGAKAVATDIMGEWWGAKGTGTMPHALIACFNGDTVAASLAFARRYPDVPCISLVDFENDCVTTALQVAKAFKAEGLPLWGVRLDTSENMVDKSIIRNDQMGKDKPTGVTPTLVKNVRLALDRNGFTDLKIIVSGGFNKEKIEFFEKNGVPVDGYGCGSSLLKGGNDFTADVVMINGELCAKEGRCWRPNSRLSLVE